MLDSVLPIEQMHLSVVIEKIGKVQILFVLIAEGPLSGATCPRFFMQKYAVYWPEGGAASQYSVFIGQKMSLTR
jgi:hypothetical protein